MRASIDVRDVQTPVRDPLVPGAERFGTVGEVIVSVCSKPAHPATETDSSDAPTLANRFLITHLYRLHRHLRPVELACWITKP
jgi:hypothetical protein